MLDGENSHYRKVVATDLDSIFYCAKYAGLHWRRQKKEGTTVDGKRLKGFTYGSFIATASMSGHIVNVPQLQAAYNAAKAGVIHLGVPSHLKLSICANVELLSQVIGCGMGSVRTCKHYFTGLYRDRNLEVHTSGDKGYLAGQDPYGVRYFTHLRPASANLVTQPRRRSS